MNKILEYIDFEKNHKIIEIARLNDIITPGIYINGYKLVNNYKLVKVIPHFDIKFNQIYLGSFLIPSKYDWEKEKNITFFKGYYEDEAIKYKKYIINWLLQYDEENIQNLYFMRISWNNSNRDNKNCILFKNGEYSK